MNCEPTPQVSKAPSHTHSLLPELASNTLRYKRHISPRISILRRNLRQLIARAEHPRAPTRPPKIDVRVIIQHIQLLAHSFQATRIVRPASRLSQNRLPLILPQPVSQIREGIDVVCCAVRVRAGVVRVEVFVHVEDQVRRAAVEVRHFHQSAARAVGDEGPG